MEVAFVSNVVYPFIKGGAEKRIHEIGNRLADEGHNVTVYGRHFWDGPKEITREGMTFRAVAPNTEIYTDERRSITEAMDFAARLALPFHQYLRRNEHDLVVASVFPYFPVLTSKLATLRTDTPLVATWHEVWRDYWDEYLGYLAPGGKIVERLTANVPQYPVAVSGVTADRLAEIGPDRESIEVIPNGISVDQIQNAPLPSERGETTFDVLYAGRLVSDKNVDLLLEAFDSVAVGHDATLGIIGDGPEQDRLKNQAQQLDNSDHVTFLGFLEDYESVLGHMRAAKVFASPSTREGFGITYAEAMAANCIVIGVDHPESAAGEVIGDAGYLPDPTVESITAALDSALSGDLPPTDPREQAQKFDWNKIADQAERMYQRAIQGR